MQWPGRSERGGVFMPICCSHERSVLESYSVSERRVDEPSDQGCQSSAGSQRAQSNDHVPGRPFDQEPIEHELERTT